MSDNTSGPVRDWPAADRLELPLQDGSDVFVTLTDGLVQLGVSDPAGTTAVVTLDWATARAVQEMLGDAATASFHADHAAVLAARRKANP